MTVELAPIPNMSFRLLPLELSQIVLQQLSRKDLKALKLSCRFWTQHVNAILFKTIHFELEEQSLLRLRNVADCHHLRSLIRTLALKQPQSPPCFDNFDRWAYSNEYGAKDSPWHNMSSFDQKRIFQEYQHDSRKVYSICEQIYQRMVNGIDTSSKSHQGVHDTIHPRHNIMEAALNLFEQSLEELSGLRNFIYIPWRSGADELFRWRSLSFSRHGLPDYGAGWWLHPDMGAMQLCYVLWCLGKTANSSSHSSHIKTLNFETEGPAFWTPSRLFYLMREDESGGPRGNLFYLDEDVWDEEEIDTQFQEHRHIHLPLKTALVIVRNCFSNLTHLRCTIGGGMLLLQPMVESLCTFLACSPFLISFDLVFGYLDNGRLGCLDGFQCSSVEQVTKALFEGLCTQRMRLQHLGLELVTNEKDLLIFLNHFNKVLKTLELTDVIVAYEIEEWESVLDKIRHCMPLLNQVNITRSLEDQEIDLLWKR